MSLFDSTDLASQLLASGLDVDAAEWHARRAENYLRLQLGVEFNNLDRTLIERVPARRTFQQLPGPVTAVESVTVAGIVLVPDVDWEWTSGGIACPAGFGRTAGAGTDVVELEVAYTSGFAAVPDELVDWAVYLASMSMRLGPLPGIGQESIGNVSNTIDVLALRAGGLFLPPEVLKSLQHRYGSGRPLTGMVILR